MGAAEHLLPLAIAETFSVYGFLHKRLDASSIVGFQIEPLIAASMALAWLGVAHFLGWGMEGIPGLFGTDLPTSLLLVDSGVVTGLPLVVFGAAARRLPYARLGLMQYVIPSIEIATATRILGEHLTRWHCWALGADLVCAGALWAGAIASGEGATERGHHILDSSNDGEIAEKLLFDEALVDHVPEKA